MQQVIDYSQNPFHFSFTFVLLGNLPYSSTVAEVLKFLRLSSEHSTVELVTARDNPARKLGFAFVNVPVESVEEVLQCNGATLGGRNIKG